MPTQYVIGNELQPAALLTKETAQASTFACEPLTAPKKSSTGEVANNSKDFPNDYYSGSLEITYPDGSKSKTFYIPNVIVYNNCRTTGNTDRWPLGFPRDVVSYLEPEMKKAYSGFEFNDKRFANTPDIIWVEGKIYHSAPNRPSAPVDVEITRKIGTKVQRIPYKGFEELFSKLGTMVAFKGSLVVSCKYQAEVKKGTVISANAKAKPVFIPIKFSIKTNVNVPEPATTSLQKTVTSEQDNADDAFWKLMESMSTSGNTGNDDDGEFTDGEEEE